MLPTVLGPRDVAAVKASPEIAGKNVEGGCIIAPGGGDNAMASLGLGMSVGDVSVSLGTSGVAAAISENPTYDLTGAVSGFADCTGHYLHWPAPSTDRAFLRRPCSPRRRLRRTRIPGIRFRTGRRRYYAGAVFRRRTHAEPSGRDRNPFRHDAGQHHTREHGPRVRRGLLCSQRDCLELIRSLGAEISRILLIGGGAKSKAIRTLAPSVFGMDVTRPTTDEYVAIGAARQAAGCCPAKRNRPHGSSPSTAWKPANRLKPCTRPMQRPALINQHKSH